MAEILETLKSSDLFQTRFIHFSHVVYGCIHDHCCKARVQSLWQSGEGEGVTCPSYAAGKGLVSETITPALKIISVFVTYYWM